MPAQVAMPPGPLAPTMEPDTSTPSGAPSGAPPPDTPSPVPPTAAATPAAEPATVEQATVEQATVEQATVEPATVEQATVAATTVTGATTAPGAPFDLPPPAVERRRRWGRWLAGGIGVLVVAWLAAWGIDTAVRGEDTARNLSVAGVGVGGLAPDDLQARLTSLAEGYATTTVDVVTPEGTETTDAATAGLGFDVSATAAAVEQAPEETPMLLRPVVWLQSLFVPRRVTPVMEVDPATLAASPLGALAWVNSRPPVEPGLTADGAGVAPTPGVDGQAITIEALAEALVDAAESNPTGTLRVAIEPVTVPPTYTFADATALANEANLALTEPVEVRVGPVSFPVDGLTLAGWLGTTPGSDALELTVDPTKVGEGITALAGEVGTPEVPVGFVVVDGVVSTTPGVPAQRCCDPASFKRIADALFTPERVALLDLVEQPLERDQAWAESLRIVEPVGSFTTNFPAGQSRAENIIRIAEILQGTVIEPGATFSVNETTGPRGIAEGFVQGGVIVNGVVVNQVGGGISQFATTLFNAAFFAGLDIPDYMMHSLYISRYPYGREATLYYPSVDLKITNNTPHGILLWPTWTDDSITVTLYSSPWIVAEQTGQSAVPAGECTRVTTERTRTFLIDQTRDVDYFRALYQPEEGVRC